MTVQQLLDQIWQQYCKAGIEDSLTILMDLADRLLKLVGNPRLAYQGTIDHVAALPDQTADKVKQLLEEAFKEMNGQAAGLFDSLLDRLPSQPDSGRYVTPRPVAEAMAAALRVERNDAVADFACGSGRLLAAVPRAGQYAGIELSPHWLWLTAVNLALHGVPPEIAVLYAGDARRWLSSVDEAPPFNVLLMDPPRMEEGGGKRSDWVEHELVWRALNALPETGQAAVLTSSDLLRQPRSHFADTCRSLITNQRLAAVITLPRKLTEPVSGAKGAVHVLAVGPAGSHPFAWMLADTGRTEDIHRMVARLLKNPGLTRPSITKDPVLDPIPDLSLVLLKPPRDARIHSIEVLQGAREQRAILVCLQREHGGLDWYGHATHRTPTWESGMDRDTLVARFAPSGWQDEMTERRFPESGFGMPLLLSTNRAVLGIALPNDRLLEAISRETSEFDLRPQSYLRRVTLADPLESPADLLRQVRQNQQEVAGHLDALLAALERPSESVLTAPPVMSDPKVPPFLGLPSALQIAIWRKIGEQVKLEEGVQTPVYFTARQVQPDRADLRQVERNLELFRRMGLIMRVSIEGQPCYRRLRQGEANYKETDMAKKGTR
jgi:hypothetical protein